uniref:Uncharacterized protein n=1 Tax=Triticum urartu TaxID=4572 RepID=A0A8R7QA03_TRIUA
MRARAAPARDASRATREVPSAVEGVQLVAAEEQSPPCGRRRSSPSCRRRRRAGAPRIGSGGAAATQVDGSALGSTVAADGALGLFLPRASGGGRSKGVISRRFKILRVYLQKS